MDSITILQDFEYFSSLVKKENEEDELDLYCYEPPAKRPRLVKEEEHETIVSSPMHELEQELEQDASEMQFLAPSLKNDEMVLDEKDAQVVEHFLQQNPHLFLCTTCHVIWNTNKLHHKSCPCCEQGNKKLKRKYRNKIKSLASCEEGHHSYHVSNLKVSHGFGSCPAFACSSMVTVHCEYCEEKGSYRHVSLHKCQKDPNAKDEESDEDESTIVKQAPYKEVVETEDDDDDEHDETWTSTVHQQAQKRFVRVRRKPQLKDIAKSAIKTSDTPFHEKKEPQNTKSTSPMPIKQQVKEETLVISDSPIPFPLLISKDKKVGTCANCKVEWKRAALFEDACPQCTTSPNSNRIMNNTSYLMTPFAHCAKHKVHTMSIKRSNNMCRRCPAENCGAILNYTCVKCKKSMGYQAFTRETHKCYTKRENKF